MRKSPLGNLRIKRKAVHSFTEEPSEITRALCHQCYDKGIEVTLVPYIMSNGTPDNAFMKCECCSAVISKDRMKHKSEIAPLGSIQGQSKLTFAVVERRRKARKSSPFEPTEEPIPLLAGKEDKDTQALLKDRSGIVTSIIDSNIDPQEEDQE